MKHCFAAFLLAVMFASCEREEIGPLAQETTPQPQHEELSYVPGVANIYLSEEMSDMFEASLLTGTLRTKSQDMNLALDELGIYKMERLFPHAGDYEERTRAEGLHRWYRVEYSQNVAMTKAQTTLGQIPGVEIFEPIIPIEIYGFNDLTSDLWGLKNTTNPVYDVNVEPVWNNYTVGNSKVIVSVVDGGVDLSHPDLASNCLVTGHYNAAAGNYIIQPDDHGTHVAGTIAAVSNNGKGVAGIAGGDFENGIKGVSIMSTQIAAVDSNGNSYFANEARGIKTAADDGAVISQNSWGYIADLNRDGVISKDELEYYKSIKLSQSLVSAIDYFIKYAGCDNAGNQRIDSPMKGGVVICAAGNDAIDHSVFATHPDVIMVSAIDKTGARASFSNYGDWVDLCAPGVGIMSTVPDGQYESMSGTSMACPHVSGVAALVLSYHGGPGFTNEMLKEKLIKGANTTAVPESYQIGNLVDAYGALLYGDDKAPAAVTDLKASGRGNGIDMEWTVPADEDGVPAYGYLFIYGKNEADVEAADQSNLDNVFYDVYAVESATGEKLQHMVKGLEFETDYYTKVIAYSYGRSYSTSSEVLHIKTTENRAPEIVTDMESTSCFLLPGQVLNHKVNISDPDSHQFTVQFDPGSPAATFVMSPDGSYNLVITGNKAEVGTYNAIITATDEYDLSSVLDVEYTIRENTPPVKIKDIDNILLTAKGKEFVIDMTEYVSDPDNEQLRYDVLSSNPKVVHLNLKGDIITGTALGYGVVDITVTAKDAKGEKVDFAFKVQVKDPSEPLSVYPNPVTDYLNVGTLDEAETTISIFSATGQLVYEETSQVSGMNPARIDMRDCAPGTYSLKVVFGGKEFKQNIVKL